MLNGRFRLPVAAVAVFAALTATLAVVPPRREADASVRSQVQGQSQAQVQGQTQAQASFTGVGAVATVGATRVPSSGDVVSINRLGPMLAADVAAIESMAVSLGVPSRRGRSFNIGMTSVRRGGSFVQRASGPSGLWQFPMAVTALPVEVIGSAMSHRVAAVAAAGDVVLGATSAALRGATPGDMLDLVGESGALVPLRLGAVVPDAEIGGAELVMSTETADRLGVTTVNRVLLFGQFDRDRVMEELARRGFVDGVGVRITRSWGPPNPDGLLSSSQVKSLLGEFDYRVNSDDSLSVDADWMAASLPDSRLLFNSIAVRARCHRRIQADLQAAFDEVAASGLAWAIDLVSTNTYGGCFNPRYARLSQSTGSISRHAWGMAIDVNVSTNGQGSVPRLDCRVVRIFRKHGFAWGGNFLVPDGMHFEWVGEPRHTWPYPSGYCRNEPLLQSAGIDTSEQSGTGRHSMFADSGLSG